MNHRLSWIVAVMVGCALSTVSPVGAESWTRFRGPNGSGISSATTVPVAWTSDDFNWQIALPGSGHSSPVVWNDKLFVTAADAEAGSRYLLCIRTSDGGEAWRREFPLEKHPKHKVNSFATCTPAVDPDRVYVLWQSRTASTVTAFTHTGDQVWQYELGPFQGGHGPGASPIVVDDLVVVCHDHEGPSYRVALDRLSGQRRWQVERPGQRACYSVPCVYQPVGQAAQIICTHSYDGITSIDAESGRVNWRIKPFGEFQQRAIGSPLVVGELVIGGSGFTTGERNLVAVRPPQASGEQPSESFRITRGAPHIPTPIAYDGLLFLWDDTGIVTCADAATGDRIWQKRVGGTFYGSPVCVDGKLYCIDRDGVVVVIRAGDSFELLARNPLGDPTFATPAVAEGVMYLRTESRLFSVGGK